MSDQNLNGDTRPPGMIVLDLILRSVLAVNFLLFFLSFIPAYQRWPNPAKLDLGGFRIDFVWVCISTLFIVVASIPFFVVGGIAQTKQARFRRTAILCLLWLVCFLIYLGYSLLNAF